MLHNTNPMLPTFGAMRRDFQRALDEVGRNGHSPIGCPISVWQDEQHVHVHADVPGVTAEDLDLQFDDGKLWIRGKRDWFGDRSIDHNERRFGSFERGIVLPDSVDLNSIDASLEDGVLLVKLTRKPESQPRSIKVRHVNQSNLSEPSEG